MVFLRGGGGAGVEGGVGGGVGVGIGGLVVSLFVFMSPAQGKTWRDCFVIFNWAYI